MIDKKEFLKILEIGINEHMDNLSIEEKNYVREKGNKIIDLLIELENKKLLKPMTFADEVQDIQSKLKNVTLNFDHIRNLYLSCYNLVEKNKQGSPKTEIKLKDELGNEFIISMNQIIIIFAWTYCSLCEVMREWLMLIMDFTKFKGDYPQNIPTGIGSLIWSLRGNNVTNISFFDDIDPKVRNSFFHLQFEFKRDKIYCKHNPKVHMHNPWKKPADNNQSDYILLEDLFKLVMNGDRSSYALMHGCIYCIQKRKKIIEESLK